MSTGRLKKQILIRLEDFWCHLWVPAILLLIIAIVGWNKLGLGHYVELDVNVEKSGFAQLFIDDGSGLSEQHSIRLPVQNVDEGSQKLRFDLSDYATVVNLRLDPIDNDGYVMIHGMDYKRSGEWLVTSLLQPEYLNSNGVRFQWNAKASRLEVYSVDGNIDPYFLVPGDFQTVGLKGMLFKRIGVFVLAILLGVILGFFSKRWMLEALVYICLVPTMLLRFFGHWKRVYTKRIDAFSTKWGLVNPTSCVVAGVVVSAIVWMSFREGDFGKGRDARMSSVISYEIVDGACHTGYISVGLHDDQGGGQFARESKNGKRVVFNLNELQGRLQYLRVDPMERIGRLTIDHVMLEPPYEAPIEIIPDSWVGKGGTELVMLESGAIRIKSTGNDPHFVSSELNIPLRNRKSLPSSVAFPFVVGFFITIGLLVYNRLQTEGLSVEQIRSMQQS